MPPWKSKPTLDQLSLRSQNTLIEHLGIEFLEVGDDFLKGRMPVDSRTKQTVGLLHGGASVALAETLGSIAAEYCVDLESKTIVGLEINANHVRSAREGWVCGVATPVHVGRSTQIWDIRIFDERDKLVCISRLTVAVIDLLNMQE